MNHIDVRNVLGTPVVLECKHAKALEFVTLEQLQSCA
jgi:hypothetical protein